MRLQCSLTHFGPHLPYALVYKEGLKHSANRRLHPAALELLSVKILVHLLLTPSLPKYSALSPLQSHTPPSFFFKPITNISLGCSCPDLHVLLMTPDILCSQLPFWALGHGWPDYLNKVRYSKPHQSVTPLLYHASCAMTTPTNELGQ